MNEAPKPPEFYIKTGLQIEPIPTNEDIWAIGLVAYLWGIYEAHLHSYGMLLTRHDKDARRIFKETIGLRQRHRMVRVLIRRNAKSEYHKEWTNLINRGGSLQIQRDKIIHGNWASLMSKDGKPAGKPFIHDAMERKGKYKWTVDYNGIFETARQIDRLVIDCIFFQMALWEPKDGTGIRASLLRRLR
jgi:hypothetical protein